MNKRTVRERKRKNKPPLGQNFLMDRAVLRKIVALLEPEPGMAVLEIGAGPGYLTALLEESGLRVTAVEIDSYYYKLLAATQKENVRIIPGDILALDLFQEAKKSLNPGEAWKVVGNLPFAVSTAILQRLFAFRSLFSNMVLMFQKEVADRLTADPGSKQYGYLTVETGFYCQTEKAFLVPGRKFKPAPRVDARLLKLAIRKKPPVPVSDPTDFLAFVKKSFAERRKTLVNNLLSACPGVSREAMKDRLLSMHLSPSVRAEALSLEQFAELYLSLAEK